MASIFVLESASRCYNIHEIEESREASRRWWYLTIHASKTWRWRWHCRRIARRLRAILGVSRRYVAILLLLLLLLRWWLHLAKLSWILRCLRRKAGWRRHGRGVGA